MAKRKWTKFLELFRLSRLRRRAPTGLAPDGLQSGLERACKNGCQCPLCSAFDEGRQYDRECRLGGWAPKGEEWKVCFAALVTTAEHEAESDPEMSSIMQTLANEILETEMLAKMDRAFAEHFGPEWGRVSHGKA